MRANLKQREERLTWARVYAVLGIISVGLLGQITSANTITPQLHWAVWYFGASILLNAFFYVLETDPYAPRYKSKLMVALLGFLHVAAISVTLLGVASVIGHFSALAGLLFTLLGGLLWTYLVFVLSRNRKSLVDSQLGIYQRGVDEFKQRTDEGMRQLEEINREYDEEVRRQTTGGSAADLTRRQEIAGRLNEKVTELQRLVAEHEAILNPRKAEVDRLLREFETVLPKAARSA